MRNKKTIPNGDGQNKIPVYKGKFSELHLNEITDVFEIATKQFELFEVDKKNQKSLISKLNQGEINDISEEEKKLFNKVYDTAYLLPIESCQTESWIPVFVWSVVLLGALLRVVIEQYEIVLGAFNSIAILTTISICCTNIKKRLTNWIESSKLVSGHKKRLEDDSHKYKKIVTMSQVVCCIIILAFVVMFYFLNNGKYTSVAYDILSFVSLGLALLNDTLASKIITGIEKRIVKIGGYFDEGASLNT